jgi:hypothetical protein
MGYIKTSIYAGMTDIVRERNQGQRVLDFIKPYADKDQGVMPTDTFHIFASCSLTSEQNATVEILRSNKVAYP